MQSSEKGINVLKQSSICCARESNSFTEHNVEEFVKIWVGGGDFEETGHVRTCSEKKTESYCSGSNNLDVRCHDISGNLAHYQRAGRQENMISHYKSNQV